MKKNGVEIFALFCLKVYIVYLHGHNCLQFLTVLPQDGHFEHENMAQL